MMQGHYRARFIRRPIDPLIRHDYHRVRNTDNISRVRLSRQRLAHGRKVTEVALGIMTPFAMTREALSVKRAFEPRLAQTGGLVVTFSTGRELSLRTIVVAGGASLAQPNHIGVVFVIEINRLV